MQLTLYTGLSCESPGNIYPCISPNGPSGAVSVTDKKPSKTISEVAGTRRSLVSHLTTGIDSPIKAPM